MNKIDKPIFSKVVIFTFLQLLMVLLIPMEIGFIPIFGTIILLLIVLFIYPVHMVSIFIFNDFLGHDYDGNLDLTLKNSVVFVLFWMVFWTLFLSIVKKIKQKKLGNG